MSEILHGVLNMPPELWCNDEVSILQRHSCYLEASRLIKELEQQLAEAKSELEQLTICGWLFQHEDTRLTEIVDNWQIEKGFEWQNPRWKKIHPVYRKGGE